MLNSCCFVRVLLHAHGSHCAAHRVVPIVVLVVQAVVLGYDKSTLQGTSWYNLIHSDNLTEAQKKHSLSKWLGLLTK